MFLKSLGLVLIDFSYSFKTKKLNKCISNVSVTKIFQVINWLVIVLMSFPYILYSCSMSLQNSQMYGSAT